MALKNLISLSCMVAFAFGCSTRPEHAPIGNESNQSTKFEQVAYSTLSTLPASAPTSVYAYGNSELQTISYWRAKVESSHNGQVANKAIIFIHGGCWLNAYDLSHGKGFYTSLANEGIDTFAVEYRRSGDEGGGWPGSLEDVKSGVSHSLFELSKLGPKEVYIIGHSAGGHLALLASQNAASIPDNITIKSVIGLAAITDIAQYARGENSCQTATTAFMGDTPDKIPYDYKRATPQLSRIPFPVILMQGNEDNIVPTRHSIDDNAQTIAIPNGGHFDWLHPQTDSYKALIKVVTAND